MLHFGVNLQEVGQIPILTTEGEQGKQKYVGWCQGVLLGSCSPLGLHFGANKPLVASCQIYLAKIVNLQGSG